MPLLWVTYPIVECSSKSCELGPWSIRGPKNYLESTEKMRPNTSASFSTASHQHPKECLYQYHMISIIAISVFHVPCLLYVSWPISLSDSWLARASVCQGRKFPLGSLTLWWSKCFAFPRGHRLTLDASKKRVATWWGSALESRFLTTKEWICPCAGVTGRIHKKKQKLWVSWGFGCRQVEVRLFAWNLSLYQVNE